MKTNVWILLSLVTLALADVEPTLTTITRTLLPATTTYPLPSAYPDYDGGVCENCPNVGATLEKDAGCPTDHPTFYYIDK